MTCQTRYIQTYFTSRIPSSKFTTSGSTTGLSKFFSLPFIALSTKEIKKKHLKPCFCE